MEYFQMWIDCLEMRRRSNTRIDATTTPASADSHTWFLSKSQEVIPVVVRPSQAEKVSPNLRIGAPRIVPRRHVARRCGPHLVGGRPYHPMLTIFETSLFELTQPLIMKYIHIAFNTISLSLVILPRRSSAFVTHQPLLPATRSVPAANVLPHRRPFTTGFDGALFMAGADPTYALRKAQFGIEDKDVLKEISMKDNAVLVDVRNEDEIEAKCCDQDFVPGKYLLSDADCDDDKLCRDLPDKDANLIVFCAKGGRASKACMNLRKRGYKNVYNAGGISGSQTLTFWTELEEELAKSATTWCIQGFENTK